MTDPYDPCSINFNFQIYLLPYDSSIEFPFDRLNLGKQIGAGAFGTVREAIAFGESVKDLIDDEVKEVLICRY